MLAPFWTDVSTNSDTHVWYHLYNRYDPDATTMAFLTTVQSFIQTNFHDSNQVVDFVPNTALKVTWENVHPNPLVSGSVSLLILIYQ